MELETVRLELLKMSRAELARAVGVHRSTIGRIEDRRQSASPETIESIVALCREKGVDSDVISALVGHCVDHVVSPSASDHASIDPDNHVNSKSCDLPLPATEKVAP
ncbi:helix-turn-helix transcriptional regulator [Notoacmeibacter sp. MSK16QG-6]|uniref:helix-turn-helix domain-containing protein n=1 Tax=Notoacmeibacter sp. MSK16QG-6 TaxID=2957982 RepID=UPI0020A0FB6E|nr:helix-turn-helix transcriptional regulator [Notoacmeibacter sp. MSK16QG-6]MCP1200084.1 helix-turn-helix transcriptional regulator [Notoacmeibacter sp. MSK16QG-6]